MDNKLSELSKPVCTDERPCINCFSGNGPCTVETATTADMKEPVAYSWVGFPNRKQLTRAEPESWKNPRDLSPLYSQEYVSALLADNEAKDKRIAELEQDELAMRASSRAVHEAQDDHINQQQNRIESLEKKNGDLGRALGAAEKRLATPVRLPTEHELHQVACSECAGNCLELVEITLRAAGFTFTVEGDE